MIMMLSRLRDTAPKRFVSTRVVGIVCWWIVHHLRAIFENAFGLIEGSLVAEWFSAAFYLHKAATCPIACKEHHSLRSTSNRYYPHLHLRASLSDSVQSQGHLDHFTGTVDLNLLTISVDFNICL